LDQYFGIVNGDIMFRLDGALSHVPEVYCIKVRAHNANLYNDTADVAAGVASSMALAVRSGVHSVPRIVPSRKRVCQHVPKSRPRQVPHLSEISIKNIQKTLKTGMEVEVLWRYEGETTETRSLGVVAQVKRKTYIDYVELGRHPFPPIDGVHIIKFEVV
jgi:hypothetical protein